MPSEEEEEEQGKALNELFDKWEYVSQCNSISRLWEWEVSDLLIIRLNVISSILEQFL